MNVTISVADLASQAIADLVEAHHDFCDGTAPPESCHRLPVSSLATPEITVWAAHSGADLVGMGALKNLGGGKGEIKSMHTSAKARGKGVARAMLQHILAEAESMELQSLWLETGVHPDFAPARTLYERHGFTETPPFGDYVFDPHSVFYTRTLRQNRSPA